MMSSCLQRMPAACTKYVFILPALAERVQVGKAIRRGGEGEAEFDLSQRNGRLGQG